MQTDNATQFTLLYGLNDHPGLGRSALTAAAHLLAIVASIATAPLLIARGLDLAPDTTTYIIGLALIVSGLATFIQVYRVGPLGSGLLSIQGTSFAFIGAMIYAGSMLGETNTPSNEVLGIILGSAAAGAACTILAGYYVQHLRRIITPTVTGITIFLLGLSLVGAAWNNLQFTFAGAAAQEEPAWPIVLQVVIVILSIGLCALSKQPWLRLTSIPIGLCMGMLTAALSSGLSSPESGPSGLILPTVVPFSLDFDIGVFLVLLPIFLVTVAESIGDLTATSLLSGEPVRGPRYWQRVRGGVMADGFNSVLAACLGTFPNTTFSQNNGVIRLTGVASRRVGYMVALMLIVLGALPSFAQLFQSLPGGVLHSATGLLFALIAWTGWRMLRDQPKTSNTLLRLTICTALALGMTQMPDLLARMGVPVPDYLALLCSFPVATGALLAMGWEVLDSSSSTQNINTGDDASDH